MKLVIHDGVITTINSDLVEDLLPPGKRVTVRASHVEWIDGKWQADMSPIGGPSCLIRTKYRSDAIKAEVEWIEKNIMGLGTATKSD